MKHGITSFQFILTSIIFRMKKHLYIKMFIIPVILFTACETTQTHNNMPGYSTTRNPQCEDINAFKVFQVLDDFVLANVCEERDYRFCSGHVVYIPKEKEKIYYDDQVITVKRGQCAIYIGTYKYETKAKTIRTVPIVKFIDSEIPEPERSEKKPKPEPKKEYFDFSF